MKIGDVIGIGPDRLSKEKRVTLLCEVVASNGDKLVLNVINGFWRLVFNVKTGEGCWTRPDGECESRTMMKIVWQEPVRGKDYNEQMEFIDSMLAKNQFSMRLCMYGMSIQDFAKSLRLRFTKSCAALLRAWRGHPDNDGPF